MQSIYALPEKTKRGPPTNKNIAIRNIKAHIANMSSKENAGFKSEYQVRYSFKISISNFDQMYIFILLLFSVKFMQGKGFTN